jgi:hypothetical protein
MISSCICCDPTKVDDIPSGPRFRYWLPSGFVDPDVVASDVETMASHGFGGKISRSADQHPVRLPRNPSVFLTFDFLQHTLQVQSSWTLLATAVTIP